MAFLDNTGLSHFWQHVLALAADLTPKSRKINGKSLDTDITITAADLGLEQAMKFLGATVSNISDASDLNTIIIGDKTIEVEAGNVVLYGGYEYVWDGDAWEQLGQEGSFVLKSTTINGKQLNNNITLSAGDVGAYTKAEIDEMVFITTNDIDTICGASIVAAASTTF